MLVSTFGKKSFKTSSVDEERSQAWILAPNIRQCPAKNRVIPNGSFTTDTVLRHEVKKALTKKVTDV